MLLSIIRSLPFYRVEKPGQPMVLESRDVVALPGIFRMPVAPGLVKRADIVAIAIDRRHFFLLLKFLPQGILQ